MKELSESELRLEMIKKKARAKIILDADDQIERLACMHDRRPVQLGPFRFREVVLVHREKELIRHAVRRRAHTRRAEGALRGRGGGGTSGGAHRGGRDARPLRPLRRRLHVGRRRAPPADVKTPPQGPQGPRVAPAAMRAATGAAASSPAQGPFSSPRVRAASYGMSNELLLAMDQDDLSEAERTELHRTSVMHAREALDLVVGIQDDLGSRFLLNHLQTKL